MIDDRHVSRRKLFGAVITMAALPSAAFTADAEIFELDRQLAWAKEQLNRASGSEDLLALSNKVTALTEALVPLRATSLQGLRCKARATAWAIEHEFKMFDPGHEKSTHMRVTASLVRDLLHF